ncbi:MAG: hypothetical protein COA49_01150 [Bacteroidetes bacterium]|nr:MAG: hypothetical protein COA49_01150 [Bacteroidota bacterium]
MKHRMISLIKATTFIVFTLTLGSNRLNAQYRWDAGIAIGTGNYLGDLGGEELTRRDLIFDLHVDQTKYSVHSFVRYRFNNIISLRGSFGIVSIKDSDASSINIDRVARNAHFRNKIYESSARVQAVFWSRPNMLPYQFRRSVSGEFYGISGLSYFRHNPQARLNRQAAIYQYNTGLISTSPDSFDYNIWYDLRDISTEGVVYSKGSIAVPMGIGAGFTVNKNWRVCFEMVWSVTFTDYLDDVSTTYADPATLNDIGRVLSSPTNLELINLLGVADPEVYIQNHQYSDAFISPRGNSSRNDAFGTLQVSVSKIIKYQSNFSKRNYGHKKKNRGWTAPSRRSKPRGYNRKGRARF